MRNSSSNIIPYFLKLNDSLQKDEIAFINDFYLKNGTEKMLQFAEKNKIIPFVADKCVFLDLDSLLWKEKQLYFFNRNTKIKRIIERMFKSLSNNDFLIYENFGSLLLSGINIALFSSGDIDIYCPNESVFKRLENILLENGLIKEDRRKVGNLINSYKYFDGDLEFYFNLERMVVAKRYNYTEKCVSERVSRYLLQKDSKIDSFEMLLYLNCLHISMGHYYSVDPSYRLYFDIEILINEVKTFDNLFNWAKEDGTFNRVYAVLYIYSQLFSVNLKLDFLQNSSIKKIVSIVLDKNLNLNKSLSNFKKIRIDCLSDSLPLIKYLFFRLLHVRRKVNYE